MARPEVTGKKRVTSTAATADDPARDARPLQFSAPPFWPAQLSIKHTAEYLDYSVPKIWQLIGTKELEVVGPHGVLVKPITPPEKPPFDDDIPY
jgi:hypothetical protein